MVKESSKEPLRGGASLEEEGDKKNQKTLPARMSTQVRRKGMIKDNIREMSREPAKKNGQEKVSAWGCKKGRQKKIITGRRRSFQGGEKDRRALIAKMRGFPKKKRKSTLSRELELARLEKSSGVEKRGYQNSGAY